jgi:hypothetical protein
LSTFRIFLVVLDNNDVAHAPFTQARAQLTERGYYDDLEILVHQEDGQLISVPAKMILPQPPGSDAKLLMHDDQVYIADGIQSTGRIE